MKTWKTTIFILVLCVLVAGISFFYYASSPVENVEIAANQPSDHTDSISNDPSQPKVTDSPTEPPKPEVNNNTPRVVDSNTVKPTIGLSAGGSGNGGYNKVNPMGTGLNSGVSGIGTGKISVGKNVTKFNKITIGQNQTTKAYQVQDEALTAIKLEQKYSIKLATDKAFKYPGPAGDLIVWIGSPENQPDFSAGMTVAEKTIDAIGESATVKPLIDKAAFTIDPKITQCIKIHPSGSEVRFLLYPLKSGTFDISAKVNLYDSNDCSGAPVPKSSTTLSVNIEVDEKEFLMDRARELWNIFWEKLLDFWGTITALFFALVLFLIRKRLKKWFGFEDTQQ